MLHSSALYIVAKPTNPIKVATIKVAKIVVSLQLNQVSKMRLSVVSGICCDLPQGNKLGLQVGKGKHQRKDDSICI